MKPGYRALISIYVSFLVYSILTLLWGSAGFFETARLLDYKNMLEQNTRKLASINSNLENEFERLRYDEDLITLKARDLGYFEKGEGLVILPGYENRIVTYTVGSYMKSFSEKEVDSRSMRLLAGIMGIIAFLLLSALKPGGRNGSAGR